MYFTFFFFHTHNTPERDDDDVVYLLSEIENVKYIFFICTCVCVCAETQKYTAIPLHTKFIYTKILKKYEILASVASAQCNMNSIAVINTSNRILSFYDDDSSLLQFSFSPYMCVGDSRFYLNKKLHWKILFSTIKILCNNSN